MPCSAARSSSQRGGTVNVRRQFAPTSTMRRRSRSSVSSSGNGNPCDDAANGPYETPRR